MHISPLLLAAGLPVDTEGISEELSQTIEEIQGMSLSQIAASLKGMIVDNLPALGKSLLLLVAGYLLIRLFVRFMGRILRRSKADEALHSFILSAIKIILYVILAITCVGSLGVNFTPMIAALGAFGLAISLAVQDILANIAGGISVLFSRPFSKGDYVEVRGQPGTIAEIGMVYTKLVTLDNKIIYLPNGDVAKATVVNYSIEPVRRIDLVFNIKETSDLDRAKAMMLEVIRENPLALADPAPILRFTDQTYAHVKLTIMVWAKSEDLFEMKSQLIADIRRRLLQEGL